MKHWRHPKNNQARKEGLKSTKIPPSSWDDIPISVLHRYYRYVRRIKVSGLNYSVFREKMKAQFPKIQDHWIKDLYYNEKQWENKDFSHYALVGWIKRQKAQIKNKKSL